MEDEDKKNFSDLLHRAAVWLLSAAVTSLGIVIYDLHSRVIDHSTQFSRVWHADLHRRIEDDLQYPTRHEAYREFWVQHQSQLNERMRAFMAAGDRFSRQDGDQLEDRIRQLERELAVMKEQQK